VSFKLKEKEKKLRIKLFPPNENNQALSTNQSNHQMKSKFKI